MVETATEDILSLATFLNARGGLHDAHLERLVWLPEKGTAALRFNDLMSNFAGLAGYTEPQPGEVLLSGVSRLLIDIPLLEHTPKVFSFDCVPAEAEAAWMARIALWPSGKIEIDYTGAEYPG